MPTGAQRSKEEELARVRRNQQRCRERKRTHIAELEQQIRHLKDQLQNSLLPSTPSTPIWDNRLKEARKENEALRNLLTAMGIDEALQNRYLESSVQREKVLSMLQVGQEQDSGFSDQRFDNVTQSSSRRSSRGEASSLDNVALPETQLLHHSTSSVPELVRPDNVQTAFNPSLPSVQTTTMLAKMPISPQPHETLAPFVPLQKSPFESNANDYLGTRRLMGTYCLTDNAMTTRSTGNSTGCSVAFSIVLQNNRKGLTVEELHERLQPGFRDGQQPTEECRCENSTLFKVLEEVSA